MLKCNLELLVECFCLHVSARVHVYLCMTQQSESTSRPTVCLHIRNYLSLTLSLALSLPLTHPSLSLTPPSLSPSLSLPLLLSHSLSLSPCRDIPAALPYIGAYLDQIYSLEMTTPTYSKDGLVNFTKMNKVHIYIYILRYGNNV